MPIVFRAYMGVAALDTERRSIAYHNRGDWVNALSDWLDLAQRIRVRAAASGERCGGSNHE